jgi:hypothetical protein
MAVRSSMDYLIEYVRHLIDDDDADGEAYFTDQEIQDRLDLNRRNLYQTKLDAAPTLVSGGGTEYHDFHSTHPFWEKDVVLQDYQGTTLDPDTADYLTGHWHFTTEPDSLPVLLTGKRYDVYGTCASLLTALISKLRKEFNFTADGLTVQRITQVRDLQDQAALYRQMSWGSGNGSQLKLVRKDIVG